MKMLRVLAAISAAGLVLLLLYLDTSRIYACSCIPPKPPLEALARADAVFSGHVVSMKEPRGWWVSSTDPITVEFRVDAVWKGKIYETMFIKTAWSSASCGFEFVLDEQYIVYVREGWVSLCSRTKSIDKASEDFTALGEGVAPVPGSNSEGPLLDLDYGILGLAVIGLLGAAAVVFALWRRSKN
ncbi:MAG: hypothetical protein F4X34_08050 [Chloroflexi bacterium]|nr:hypothetical protein [Chloroflexota bacterium]